MKRKIRNNIIGRPYYVFIDELGTLPDPKDKFVVIAGVELGRIKEARNFGQ